MFSNAPLPKTVPDVGPGGGFATNMGALNALSQQNMQTRLLQAQGNQAQQQANFTPYQYATQALANPSLWMTPEGRAAGQNIIAQLPKLAQQGTGQGNNSNLNQLDSKSLGQMIMSKIGGAGSSVFNKLTGNSDQPQNAMNSIPGAQGVTQPNAQPSSSGGPNTPASQAANQNNQGLNLTPNPNETAKTNAEAQNASVIGSANAQTDEQKAFNEATDTRATNALTAQHALETFMKNYNDSSYVGARAGSVDSSGKLAGLTRPGHTLSSEQLADNAQSELLQAMAQMQGSSLTDDGRALLAASKGVSRTLDRPAAKILHEKLGSGLERIYEERPFINSFFRNNPTATKQDLVAMLNLRNRNSPAYDYTNQKPLPENEGKENRDLYTSKAALKEYQDTGDFHPHAKKKIEIPKEKKQSDRLELPEGQNIPNRSIQGLPEGKVEKTDTHNGKPAYMINGKWYGAK